MVLYAIIMIAIKQQSHRFSSYTIILTSQQLYKLVKKEQARNNKYVHITIIKTIIYTYTLLLLI